MISIASTRDSVSKFLSGIVSLFILVIWFFNRPPRPILPPTLPERPTFRTTLCLCLAVCAQKAGGERERDRERERLTVDCEYIITVIVCVSTVYVIVCVLTVNVSLRSLCRIEHGNTRGLRRRQFIAAEFSLNPKP
jgi:hypothetical protein